MTISKLLPPGELEQFEQSLREYGSRCIRLRTDRVGHALPFAAKPVPWFDGGYFLDDSEVRPAAFLNYAVADYYIQDAASLLPLTLLDVQPGDVICDLCAAPGGKASAIAERLGANGFLLANESIRSRLDVLKYALARTGNPTYAVCSYDPDELADHTQGLFDAILVDAPCSGQTLVGKNKRDDNAFASNQIEHCALRQQRILGSAIKMLKPGGRLVYSTCTFAVEENESQIRWLLDTFPNCWEPIEPASLSAWKSPVEPGCYRLWPHRDDCAGGFAAGLRLVRELETPAHSAATADSFGTMHGLSEFIDDSKSASKGRIKKQIQHVKKSNDREAATKRKNGEAMLGQLGELRDCQIEWIGDQAVAINEGVASVLGMLPSIKALPASVLIESGSHFIPTQALAMMDGRQFVANDRIEFNDEQAFSYMSGNAVAFSGNGPETAKGWVLACWRGKALGWVKAAGNRFNNHLPPWARLT